jgi:hypothetical protein
MLSLIMPSVFNPNAIMLNVVMLSVVVLFAVMLSVVMWNVIKLGIVMLKCRSTPGSRVSKVPISLTGMTHSTACRAVNEQWPSRKPPSSSTSGPSTPKSGPGRIGVHPAGWTRQSTTSSGQPELSRCNVIKKIRRWHYFQHGLIFADRPEVCVGRNSIRVLTSNVYSSNSKHLSTDL